jgi:hypothetical protein
MGLDDNNIYLQTMRNFRNNVLQKDIKYKSLLVEYDIVGPKIAETLYNDPLKEKITKVYFNKYIKPVTKLINQGMYDLAINIYIYMTNSLRALYDLNHILISLEEINNADIEKSGHGIYKTKKITLNS